MVRRIGAASSASARSARQIEAAGTPDWSVSERRHSPERGCHGVTGVKRCLRKRNKPSRKAELISFVEMGGLEPPSKHRTRELSTRLVPLWFSTRGCRRTGYPRLILWILAELKGVTPSIRFE